MQSSRTTRTSAPRKETELESHMNEDEIYQIARLLRKMRPKDDMQDVYKQMTVEVRLVSCPCVFP